MCSPEVMAAVRKAIAERGGRVDRRRLLAGGAAAMNLVIAANALGYGTNWITNWYSDVEEGRKLLGLAPHERVVAFVHIGSYSGVPPERPRPDVPSLYKDYSGPWEG